MEENRNNEQPTTDPMAPEHPNTNTSPEAKQTHAPIDVEAGSAKPTTSSMTMVTVGVVALILAAAALWWFMGQGAGNQSALLPQSGGGAAGVATEFPEVVAVVNGEDVSGDELQESVAQTEQLALQQGANPNDSNVRAQINENALTLLINTKLLIQAAERANVSVPDEAVTSEIANIETRFGGAEALESQLGELDMTREDLRVDIREQLLVDAYITAAPELDGIEVTEEEVQGFYQSVVDQGQELPPLEEVEAQIRAQLEAQERQQATGQLVERLRSGADIEVLI